METVIRDWGQWKVLEESEKGDFKVKMLYIMPGEAISAQYHNYREECWVIISGRARVRQDRNSYESGRGEVLKFKRNEIHKVTCISKEPLVAVEVQLGSMCVENDIVRID